MTLFQLVKITLDSLYAEAKALHGSKTDKRINEAIALLSASYGQLANNARAPISYKDAVTRFAYVFKYVAAHGDYIIQLLEAYRNISGGKIFGLEKMRLTCIGGGPGSDLLAIIKYLLENESEGVKKVTCYLIDGEQAWADTWTELDDAFNSNFRLSTNFQKLDVTNPTSWADQRKFLEADVFTVSYFVSEVMSLDHSGTVTNFWDTVFSSARSGALFFYTDNGSTVFDSYFDKLWKKHKLKRVYGYENQRVIPRFSEQTSDLGNYARKFNHNPKVQAFASARVLKKP